MQRSHGLLKSILKSIVVSYGFSVLVASASHAQQITSDGTLNTQVTRSGNTFTIRNGTAAGNNLFHSFQEFSIPTNGSATFDLVNTPNISTIFSRVTGSSPSNIDGAIQASHSVNLFLLNPNGILFGANASLNIGGSFLGSTASSVRFADGNQFDTTTASPLLTISAPIGLQMGATSGSIQVQGNANVELFPSQNLGIVGSPGATIALLGNGVTFTGGVMTAPAGRLEVGSVATGEVQLNPTPLGWQFDYSKVQNFADLELTARSSLWTPYPVANPFGGLQVAGRNIRLDRSQIAAATLGDQAGGDIQVLAQGTLTIEGTDFTAPYPSGQIINQVMPGATGAGGAIRVQAGRIVAREGGDIQTLTIGSGDAGSITVNADSILLTDPVFYRSPILGDQIAHGGIASITAMDGDAGQITVNARQIEMYNGGRILTLNFPTATGKGGDITVNSDRIIASGVTEFFGSSGIQALAMGFGEGGNVQIDTGTLSLSEGAIAMTFAYRISGLVDTGFGDAGNFTVTARDRIDVVGDALRSGSQTSTLGSVTVSSGNGGDVRISAPVLSVREGGSVTAGTAAVVSIFGDPSQSNRLGDGGNLTLSVQDLEVSGLNRLINNGSSVGTFTFGNGDAGNATINADRIRILNGANILASTLASGNSGELRINAREIQISGQQGGRDAAILASADQFTLDTRQAFGLPDSPTGRTARLVIAADQISLSDRGKISTTHQGLGDASELEIRVNRLSLNNQAAITATTRTGNGGNATIQVRDLLVLRNGSRISVESAGLGNGGNITLNAGLIASVNNSDIIANAIVGNGGNIRLTTQGLIGIAPRPELTAESDITASSKSGVSGTIQVNTIGVDPNSGLIQLPETLTDSSQQIASGCVPNEGSSFVITGRGGIPINPMEEVRRDRTWADLRDLTQTSHPISTEPATQPALVEATEWMRDSKGQVILLAKNGIQPSHSVATCASPTP